jgi:acylphosphatase
VGSASNLRDGRVEVVAEGTRKSCDALLAALRGGQAPGRVDQVVERWSAATGLPTSFVER